MTEPVKKLCQNCQIIPAVKRVRTPSGVMMWKCQTCIDRKAYRSRFSKDQDTVARKGSMTNGR